MNWRRVKTNGAGIFSLHFFETFFLAHYWRCGVAAQATIGLPRAGGQAKAAESRPGDDPQLASGEIISLIPPFGRKIEAAPIS
jgi:hypothetical protein